MRFSFSFPCGLELERYVRELDRTLSGGFIRKVYQEPTGVFSFRIHRRDWSGWLVFSSRPEIPCLIVCPERFDASHETKRPPQEPPPLCRVLRRNIEGFEIRRVVQVAGDRIIELQLMGRDGDRKLVFELLGRFSNLLLLAADGKIDACLRTDARRAIRVGGTYHAPAISGKVAFDAMQVSEVLEEEVPGEGIGREDQDPDQLAKRICARVAGISPLLARECLDRSAATGKSLGPVLKDITRVVTDGGAPVYAYTDAEERLVLVTPIRMGHLGKRFEFTEMPSFLEAMARWYRETAAEWELAHLRARLTRRLREKRRRLRRDREATARDLVEAEREAEFRLAGEMILAQPDRVSRGMKEVALQNLYGSGAETITVSLDPALAPQENATRYFQRAAKAQRKRDVAHERKKAREDELASVESLLAEAEAAADADELRAVAKRIENALGPDASSATQSAGKEQRPDPLRRVARVFTTTDGHTVYVARGAREGDILLRRFARGSDLWLHTRDVPGSHVVLRKEQKQEKLSEETLLDAGHLAAHFSKARGEAVVPLHVTEVKNLRRPRSGSPGKVTIARDRTLAVRVEENRLKRLLASRR